MWLLVGCPKRLDVLLVGCLMRLHVLLELLQTTLCSSQEAGVLDVKYNYDSLTQ